MLTRYCQYRDIYDVNDVNIKVSTVYIQYKHDVKKILIGYNVNTITSL